MKFYKDSTGMCSIGDIWYLSPGNIFLRFDGSNVSIEVVGVEWRDKDPVLYKGAITSLTKSTGVAYTDKDDLLSEVNTLITGGGSGGAAFKTFSVEITRPADATPYSINDVVSGAVVLNTISNVAKATGSGVHITRVRIQTEDTGVAGVKFNVHIYGSTPTTTGLVDNGAFTISYANATKRVGAIPVVMGTGNQNTVGMNDYNQVMVNPTARDLYIILETATAFTPSGNSTKFTIFIDCELSN